jgi:Na+-transporting NADH:ubiquinone oxidoreductase subunit NqrA
MSIFLKVNGETQPKENTYDIQMASKRDPEAIKKNIKEG